MATVIKLKDNRIIFDGHADSMQDCQLITAMCDSLAESENFRTVKYESGYAEFEKVTDSERALFPVHGGVLIYSNDGGTLVEIFSTLSSRVCTLTITDSGLSFTSLYNGVIENESSGEWAYNGSKKFLGLSKTSVATEPDTGLAIGDTYAFEEMESITFYIVEEEVGNIQINIAENGTTTLATAGKYCDRNIDVNVEVSGDIQYDADEVVDGTISGNYFSDKVTNVRQFAFDACNQLVNISLPNCMSLGQCALRNATALESANLPICTTFYGNSHFNGCGNLKTINASNLTFIENGQVAFSGCKNLEKFDAPNLASIGNTSSMFNGCTRLKKVNLAKLSGATIATTMFTNCNQLVAVVLGGNQLNPLAGAFSDSNITQGTCYFYVPDDLVDTYKTATNWAVYADQIKSISELEE